MTKKTGVVVFLGALFLGLTSLWAEGNDKRIAWYGTWKAGLAQAKKSHRPIFLVSGAPQCRTIPGVW